MAFHDVQLPSDIERGAQGGPRFHTTVAQLQSGYEKRNIDWSATKGEWDLGYGIQDRADLDAVINFFYARQGRAHSFRFKDWADYKIGDTLTTTPQQIGTGTGALTTFQIEKRYTSGGYTFHRTIQRPVTGTLRVFVNSVERLSGWTCNYLTGIITFTSGTPANGTAVQVLCEFDVPVRFDTDALDVNMEIFSAGSVPHIPVCEVKGE